MKSVEKKIWALMGYEIYTGQPKNYEMKVLDSFTVNKGFHITKEENKKGRVTQKVKVSY